MEVVLTDPFRTDEGDEVRGYCRVFGVRATPDAVVALVDAHVADGTVDWSESTTKATHVSESPRSITPRLVRPLVEGVWYESGRIFYLGDE